MRKVVQKIAETVAENLGELVSKQERYRRLSICLKNTCEKLNEKEECEGCWCKVREKTKYKTIELPGKTVIIHCPAKLW